MERRLGCKLFDRLGRTIKPTRKAEILYTKSTAILDDLNTLEDELRAEDSNMCGELILGASTVPGAYILPYLATLFKAEHPQISFEIRISDSGEIIDAVLNHDLLIGVSGTWVPSNKLNFQPFAEDELILAAAPGRKMDRSVSLDTLKTLPFLLREKGSGTRKSMEEFWAKKNLEIGQLNIAAVLGSNAAIKEAIKADLGVSIVSRVSISDELATGRIREIEMEGGAIKRMFYVATHTKRTLPNHYNLFLGSLITRWGVNRTRMQEM